MCKSVRLGSALKITAPEFEDFFMWIYEQLGAQRVVGHVVFLVPGQLHRRNDIQCPSTQGSCQHPSKGHSLTSAGHQKPL